MILFDGWALARPPANSLFNDIIYDGTDENYQMITGYSPIHNVLNFG